MTAPSAKRSGSVEGSGGQSLVWRLGNAALAGTLPLILLTFVLVAFVLNEDRQTKRALLLGATQALADVVELQLDKYFVLSNAFSHSAFLSRDDADGFVRQAAASLVETPEATLILSRPDGAIVASSPQLAPDSPLLLNRVDLVKRAIARGTSYLSDVQIDPANMKAAHLSVETPVFRDGQPIYEVALTLSVEQFRQLLLRQNYSRGWSAGLVDHSGAIVTRVPDSALAGLAAGARASDETLEAIRNPSESVVVHRNLEGDTVVSAYAPTPYGWTAAVAARYSLIEGGRSAMGLALALCAAALAATFGLFYLYGQRLAKRVGEIQAQAEQLVAGAPLSPQRSGVREIDALSASLAEASTILRTRAEQQRRAESDLRKSEEHFRLLTDSLPQLVWTAKPDGRIEYTNARRELYGDVGKKTATWESIIHPEDRRATAETWLLASEAGHTYEMEHRLKVAGRGYLWHLSRAVPLLDAQGAVVRWYGTTTDIDDNRQREQNIRSLTNEVNHRSRNLLAVAQAIARRSVAPDETAVEFERKFSERLLGLVASQDLLTRLDWRGVPLEALLRVQTSKRMQGSESRVTCEGPALLLTPAAAQTLGLALQELWSNAVRHGAMSNATGAIAINWRIEPGDDPLFEIEWVESGGPSPSREARKGFGRLVIERMTADGLGAKTGLALDEAGLRWTLRAPLKNIAAENG